MGKKTLFIFIATSLLLSGCSLSQQPINANKVNNPQEKNSQINKKLNLSEQNIQKIPEYVFNQTNLEELDISKNQLTGSIQAEIRHLQNLKVLNVSNNQMTGIPAEIGQLHNLQVLDLSNNKLTGLPHELGNLQNLKILNISGNNYSKLDLGIIRKSLPKETAIIK